jgi:two-component system, cell cycle sensor histidine kinase and response regulator CckA
MRLEGALQRASKMEAIGTMAGGVAHDLNNILSGLVGYPELMLLDLPEDSRLRKPLITIQKSGEKAAAIVQDMLTLARRGVSITEVVNLNNIIHDYLASPEHQKMISYHPDVFATMDLEPALLNIVGSQIHLSKTLMNLISNAMEAMPSGGEIKISTRNEYVDMPIKGYDDVNEGDYVVLSVSDNGTGISPEDQERIFEPFYTKKKMGRSGTGLGMAVVWGTVKDHDGYIDLTSDVNKGSTFKLYFPITRKELVEADSLLSIEEYMACGESILVVDDIKEQREIASSMLTRLGYSVASVQSGEAAVEYLTENPVDLLVLDMIMPPGIDGLETYKRVLKIHPGQKAVVASGFAETERVKEAQRLGAGAYVKKPYLLKNIGPAIRRELDKKN